MISSRIVEYVFFFGLMITVGFLVWKMLAPFISALALAAVIVTICYPMYTYVLQKIAKGNETLASLTTTLLVLIIIIIPVIVISSMLVGEAVSVYKILGAGEYSLADSVGEFESAIQTFAPNVDLNLTEYAKQTAAFFASNLGIIFAGTVSTVFLFFIALIGSFYFFRDGKVFTKQLVVISPLPDDEDELILNRLAVAIRSVATGTVFVALIQGTSTAIGMAIFGFERAILLGVIAAFGALIPSVGTSIVFVPSVLYLLATGQYAIAAGLTVWGVLAVGLIDNLLGPYLMSRGNPIHPFLILLSVLGGVAFFGPIGFIVGPVLTSLFIVLLELYSQHIAQDQN